MQATDAPLYCAKPGWKGMGNAYFIYGDRIELRCRFPFFTRTIVIRKADLIAIEVFRRPVIRTSFSALKLDLADLNEHVGIRRKNGLFKQLRFTPENPREFVAKAKEFLQI